MNEKKNITNLTARELDVLEVLWTNKKPLLASDIIKLKPSLSISSVQLSLRNLLKKEIIEIAEIVYSGTVLSRSYRPLLGKHELMNRNIISQFKNIDKNMSTTSIVSTLLQHEKNEEKVLKELEELLQERRALLQKKEKKEDE
jgi:predicted transcriptional regulator